MEQQFIDGRYRIIRTLSGGMGSVHLCVDQAQNDQSVAIKMIKPDFLVAPDARSKFLREANVWIQLGWHANIVHAQNVQYIPTTHEVYIVSEWVQASAGLTDPSLRSWLEAGRLNLALSLRFAGHIISGMKHATRVFPDLVHRDLKPENILIGVDEVAKINDFGIASSTLSGKPIEKIFSTGEDTATHSGIGTLPYMSPEQCTARPLDSRSDIYAFGLILFELLTGQIAITGRYEEELIYAHINGTAERVVGAAIGNTHLMNFIKQCVISDPNKRYRNWNIVDAEFQRLYQTIMGQPFHNEESSIDVSLLGFYQKANSYLALGAAYLDTGETQRAIDFTSTSLEMAQKIASPRLEAAALSNLGLACYQSSDYEQAIRYYEAAEKINFKLYDLVNQAINLGNLGGAHQKIGHIEAARDYFIRSLSIANSEEVPGVQASQLANLAVSFMEEGNFSKAEAYYQKAIGILETSGADIALATNLGNYANVLFVQGKIDDAQHHLLHAYEIVSRRGVIPQQAVILGNLANIFIAKSDLDRALQMAQKAADLSEKMNDQSSLCKHLATIGTIMASQGDYKAANRYFEKALAISKKINDFYSTASIFLGIGNLHIGAGNLKEAVVPFQKCIDICQQINNRHTLASGLGNLGKVYAALGNYKEAVVNLRKSMEIAEEIGAEEISGRAAWTIGVILEMMGDRQLAIEMMSYAVGIFRKFNLPEYDEAVLHLRMVRQQ